MDVIKKKNANIYWVLLCIMMMVLQEHFSHTHTYKVHTVMIPILRERRWGRKRVAEVLKGVGERSTH